MFVEERKCDGHSAVSQENAYMPAISDIHSKHITMASYFRWFSSNCQSQIRASSVLIFQEILC